MSSTFERPRSRESRFALRWPLLVVFGGLVLLLHLRLARKEAYVQREPAIPAHAEPRIAVVRIEQQPAGQHIELEVLYADNARSPTEVTLPLGTGSISGVELHDDAGKLLPIEAAGYREHSILRFELPPSHRVRIAFWVPPPSRPTFGWGHRAVANTWIGSLVPSRIPLSVQIEVPSGTTAPGWVCGTGEPRGELTSAAPRVCATQVRGIRRTLALPIEPYDDVLFRITFATAIGTAISALMYAIYRRWSALAYAMGARDEDLEKGPVTLEELAVEYRRLRAQRPSEPETDVDPLEAVALVARGITAVLSVIGSLFLVAHFFGGLLPWPMPLVLTIWSLVGGAVVVVATGIDRPRPWLAIALLLSLGLVALHPLARWIGVGLVPLAAGVLMQLTAKR